jgi:hypothetical protein
MISVVPQDEEHSEFNTFKRKVGRDITIKMWAIVVSHPFQGKLIKASWLQKVLFD